MISAATAFAAVNVAAVAGLTYATVSPTSTFWGPAIARGPTNAMQIALTFDDGPTPGSTDRVMEILTKTGVKASFFVIGGNVRRHPELLRRIHEQGHLIANHTFDHSHYTVFGRLGYWKRQIAETDELLESIVGERPAIFARRWA